MEGRFIRLFYYVCLFLGIAGCGPCTCNPKSGNLAIVLSWDVPTGQTYTFANPEGGLNSVEFKARVFFPANDSTGTVITDGKHPLVIFGHGRYGAGAGSGFPNNYLHATYLMNQLTSWGYICVTVNFDVVHSLGSGIQSRGELFLKAIDFMSAQNSNAGSMFHDKIDMDHIGIIGHSRGGGGAIAAVHQNQAQGSPRKIKALATISPTGGGGITPVTGMPQLMIYGTWDGDLSNAPGYPVWDGSARDKTKIYVEVYGANHFYFSDDLVYASETQGILRENHQNMAKGFINAFFDQYVRDSLRYSWPQYLTYEKKVDTVEYHVQYQHPTFLAVDNGSPLGTAATNNLGGGNSPNSLTLFDDSNLGSGAGQHGNTNGLRISWDAASDGITFNIPVTNASAYSYISFRASQRHGETGNTVNTFKNLRVKITDNGGANFTVPIGNTIYKGLQYPDQEEYPGGPGGYKNIPSTFRLPLSAFTGINKTQVKTIAILFDAPNTAGFVNNTGAITFDDLEFTN
jgi:dienelactone hydrolase